MRKIMRLANSRFRVCREHSNACNPRGGCAESELGRGRGRSSSVTDGLTWVVLGKGELVNSPDSRFKSCQQDKWRRKWQPTLVFLPGESQGQRSLVGVYGVAQSRTRLKRLSMHACTGEGNGNPLQHSCLENPRDRGAWWVSMGLHRVGHSCSDLAAAVAAG